MTDETNQPSSTESPVTEAAETAVSDVTAAVVAIPAEVHAEAQGVFASLVAKLENFEHALAADAKAELDKLKALLHL